ncbi:hypothetical protein FHX08_002559 [Rhizobium sp. BK529]|nr:hypothetical protein [Rhizobium sp. BK529]TCS06636.1 hypothetical protein EV281_102241 [Rhizobium sp. BK418]
MRSAPAPERLAVSLLGQSALLRTCGALAIAAVLWLAIYWAVLLP